MLKFVFVCILLGSTGLAAFQVSRRSSDEREAAASWQALSSDKAERRRFDLAMVAMLPEPARRFFQYAIQPGTPLATVVELTMDGDLSLGSKQKPGYKPMRASQILAAPRGLVWRVQAGEGLLRISGSDGMVGGRSWTRFWLFGVLPVVRAGDNPDHLRASFGRVVAEAAFWAPATLLPQSGVEWSAVDADGARATVSYGGMRQEVTIRVNGLGQPVWVTLPRWTNANADGEFRLQPFGRYVSDFRNIGGFRIPHKVDGGNFFGTEDYFPFYRARVISAKFL